ncbi:MAG: serine/threonine-protein phosphatase [Phycisphaerales bacterium]|nr:serine/threonine-protein phosphatase [Phycisphaerales bacterium]
MYRIQCSEVWGGIRNQDQDVCSTGLTASLYSSACNGGKGGDIYYLSVCGGDVLTRVAIADVVGHGEAVSQVSEWLYQALQRRMNDADGNSVLSDLNHLAAEKGFQAMTTAAVAGFYQADSHLYFAYAGHYPVLIWHRDDGDWRTAPLQSTEGMSNLPLGVMKQTQYEQQSTPLAPGDRMLLYTDGLIEAPDRDGELFGEERLHKVLQDHGRNSLSDLKNAVLGAVRQHTEGPFLHDDVTLLAIEVN